MREIQIIMHQMVHFPCYKLHGVWLALFNTETIYLRLELCQQMLM